MKSYIFMVFVFLSTLYATQIQAQEETAPNWTWATNIDGFESGSTNNNYNIHTDKAGNNYVIDQVENKLKIAKYDATGTLVWDRLGNSGSGTVTPTDIAVDEDGNYYISGHFKDGDVTFGSITLQYKPNYTKDFVVKFDANGNVLWASKSTILDNVSNSFVYSMSLAIDANKNVYFAGYSRYYVSSQNRSIYHGRVLKYSPNGVQQWEKGYYNQSGLTIFNAIDSDDFGNTYINGISNNKAIQTKYDPFGNLVWEKTRSENSTGLDITADNVGNSYVVGSINISNENKDAFVAKYDAAGNKVWEQQGIGGATDVARGVVIDDNGNVFVTGSFQQKTTFGPLEIENANSGVSDVFVAKYNSLGDILWLQQAGNNGTDAGAAIGVDEAGNCYLNGYYTLSTLFGDTTIQGNDQFIPFLAKIGDLTVGDQSITTLPVASSNFNAGGAIKVPFSTKGTFAQDTKFTVQLSNSSGSFFNPTFIGVGTTSPINAIIPSLTLPGSGYRVRVITEKPELLGTDNGSALTINNNESLITPNWTWAKKIGAFNNGSFNSRYGLHTDKDGNNYTIYQVNNQLHIDKVDANGTLIWTRVGSEGDDATVTPTDIVVDADGNYYVSGHFKDGDVTFGSITLQHKPNYTKDFVVKFDANGNVLWASKSTILDNVSNSFVYAMSLAIDANKNVYFVGYSRYYVSSQNRSIYHGRVLKYSPNGVQQWEKGYFNQSGLTIFNAIASDDFGNTYINGISNNKALQTKYDPFGNLVWEKTRSENSTGLDITVDNFGNNYVVGSINVSNDNKNAFVAKYDAAGNKIWEQKGIGAATDLAKGVVIDDSGNVFVTGSFQHNTDFSTLNVTNSNSGTGDVFVAKYDTDGNIVWIQQAGGNGADSGAAVGVDENGNCYVNGYYTVKTTFGDTTLQADGQYIPFLAKIGESAATTLVGNAIVKGENFCGGSVVTVDYAIGGKYGDDNVFTAQLSDSAGSFDNPTDIGTLESPRNTSIYAIIPIETPKGEGYRIRVTSSNPALIGNANEIDIKINQDNCNDNTNELTAKPIVTAEYFINTDPGVGKGTAIDITNGVTVSQTFDVTFTNLDAGFHSIFIRTRDEEGNWSMYDGRVFYIQPETTELTTSPVVAGEYFFDTEPGIANGTALTSFDSKDLVNLTNDIPTDGLSEGFHNLFLRTKNANGVWSMYEGRVIYIQPEQTQTEIVPIVAAEYYFNTDPGFGKATTIDIGSESLEVSSKLENIETSTLDKGEHNIYVRVKNKNGTWSLTENSKFNICSNVLAAPEITGSNSFCAGESITLTASNVTEATSYEWFGPNNFTAKTQSITINSITDVNAGAYIVRAINDNAECKEGNISEIDITINTTDAPTGESIQSFEEGNTIADIVVNGSNILWFASSSDARNNTNLLEPSTMLENSKTYYATQTIDGCTSTSLFEVTVSTVLNTESLESSNFKLYPNPVKGILQIKNTANVRISKIEIYNVLGKKIKSIINPKDLINVSQLAKGVYVLNIYTDQRKTTKRIMKK